MKIVRNETGSEFFEMNFSEFIQEVEKVGLNLVGYSHSAKTYTLQGYMYEKMGSGDFEEFCNFAEEKILYLPEFGGHADLQTIYFSLSKDEDKYTLKRA